MFTPLFYFTLVDSTYSDVVHMVLNVIIWHDNHSVIGPYVLRFIFFLWVSSSRTENRRSWWIVRKYKQVLSDRCIVCDQIMSQSRIVLQCKKLLFCTVLYLVYTYIVDYKLYITNKRTRMVW